MRGIEKKEVLLLSGVVAAGLILVLFGYIPIVWQKYVISRTLQRQTLPASQVKSSVEKTAVLERQIADLEKQAQRFEVCVPRDAQFASLWQQIADLIGSHNLGNQQVRPGTEVGYDDFNVVSLDIQCSGTLPEIFAFVRSLEQMDRLVRLEAIELTNDTNLTGELTFSAKAQAFYQTSKSQKSS